MNKETLQKKLATHTKNHINDTVSLSHEASLGVITYKGAGLLHGIQCRTLTYVCSRSNA